MKVIKFFNADATEPAAAPEQAPLNIAALMATKGVINDTPEMVVTPIEIPKAEEPTPQPAEPAVPAISSEQAEPTPTPAEPNPQPAEEPQLVATPIVAAPAEAPKWQEVLKSTQPEEVLKELGFDEKMVGFLNHWKSGGDVLQYIKEANTDYLSMSAEDVMRHQLRKEYPKASERAIDVLYKNEIVEKYKLDPERFSEEEVEDGKLLLDMKAQKYREEFEAAKQQFILSQPPQQVAPKVDPQVDETQRIISEQRQAVMSSPYYNKVLSEKALVFGEGDEQFRYPIETNDLLDVLYDSEKFAEAMFTVQLENNQPVLKADPEHQALVAAVAKHGKKIFVEMAKHYKALGGKATIEPITNPSAPAATPMAAEVQNLSPAALMAKQGRVVSGGY